VKKLYERTSRSGVRRLQCNTDKPWTLGWRWQLIDRDIYLRYCNPRQWDTERARKPRRWGRRPDVRRARPDKHESFIGREFFGSHRFAFGRPPASPATHWLLARSYEEMPF
jgi:hypothetical protein